MDKELVRDLVVFGLLLALAYWNLFAALQVH